VPWARARASGDRRPAPRRHTALVAGFSAGSSSGDLTISRSPRSFRPHDYHRGPAINDRIRAREVLLINESNEKVGVVPTIEALRRAHEAGLDLVEVSAETTPPVCRILDFGKYKYEQAKKEKASKSKTKAAEMKEVRLGRSMKIDPHDVSIRVDQAHRFLLEGHKVQIVQNFRGRELQHKHLGDARMKQIIERLAGHIIVCGCGSSGYHVVEELVRTRRRVRTSSSTTW